MIRSLLQSLLCLILCPLLAAQQIVQEGSPSHASQPLPERASLTLSPDTEFTLVVPGPVRFSKTKVGSVVQFVVDRDVVLGGVTVIHAGVPVAGVADQIKRGSRVRHRVAEMEIRVTEMVSGKPIELHLRCFEAADRSVRVNSPDEPGAGFNPVKLGVILGVAFAIGLALLAAVAGDR